MTFDIPEDQLAQPVEIAQQHSPATALRQRDFASFWMRLGAALLDMLALSLIKLVFDRISGPFTGMTYPLVTVLYSIGFIAAGATPGMRLVKIRVVDVAGNPPGIMRSIVRFIIPALGLLPPFGFTGLFLAPEAFLDRGIPLVIVVGMVSIVIGLLDPLWMIWDAQKQTLHDKLASTYVVNVSKR